MNNIISYIVYIVSFLLSLLFLAFNGNCSTINNINTNNIYPDFKGAHKDSSMEVFITTIKSINTSDLSLLPQNDCRLFDIETDVYLYYVIEQGAEIPEELGAIINRKRKDIDYKRSFVDSLLYVEALQAVNSTTPNWDKAIGLINKSLSYNNFFIRSILFKWSYLQRKATETMNWDQCLLFAKDNLLYLSWNPRIINMANALYASVLKQLEYLISENLYQEALNLYNVLQSSFLPEFPLQYYPYKEQNILYSAYQGMFNSYYIIAQKAFDQKMYQLSQRHSLLAYRYYKQNEKYMSGINPSLNLLEDILNVYKKFIRYSDPEEKAYYGALVDSIYKITDLYPTEKSSGVDYDINKEFSSLSISSSDTMNEENEEESKIIKTFVLTSKERDSLYSISLNIHKRNLTIEQAQKQWNAYVETARLANAKRKFIDAQVAYSKADSLRRFYPVKTSSDFTKEKSNNDLLAIEQTLNKAQYKLWNNDIKQGDSLYQYAISIASGLSNNNRIVIQSLLDNFIIQKQNIICAFYSTKWNGLLKDIKRQIAYFHVETAVSMFNSLEKSISEQLSLYPCQVDTVLKVELKKQITNLLTYKSIIDSSFIVLANGDTNAFILLQLSADKYYNSNKLNEYVSGSTSLFSRLSYEKNFTLLSYYALVCLQNNSLDQAEFILSYLKELQYTSAMVENLNKKLKKIKG